MPQWIRGPELIIILVIVVLVFGVGRISKIGPELGRAIRGFREGLKGEGDDDEGDQLSTQEDTDKESKEE